MHPDWRVRVLDTYDWYSPKYQSAHTHHEVFQWFKSAGLKEIAIGSLGISMLGNKSDQPNPLPHPAVSAEASIGQP